jgi:hypothetical protein
MIIAGVGLNQRFVVKLIDAFATESHIGKSQ